jgi:hypothetical protein
MKTPLIPPEFSRLGSGFIQDDASWGRKNFPEWAKRAISLTLFTPAQINSLKGFIDEILASTDEAYIDRMWNSMGAPMRVHVHGKEPASTGGLTHLIHDGRDFGLASVA